MHKGGNFFVLAATSKVCPKGLVTFETLEAVHTQLAGLPVKEKKFFKTREAVEYLFKDIHDAIVNKNYTIEDISEYIIASGWHISRTALRQFWKCFRSSMGNYTNSQNNSTKKANREHTKLALKNSSEVSQNDISDDKQRIIDETIQRDVLKSLKNAHFDMPPDTEDL